MDYQIQYPIINYSIIIILLPRSSALILMLDCIHLLMCLYSHETDGDGGTRRTRPRFIAFVMTPRAIGAACLVSSARVRTPTRTSVS